jgi:hypothetical protein
MKDLLRFDTIVAICALLMSTVTAGAMVYQTRVLQDQFSATVWPYLSVDTNYGVNSFAVRVVNQGVGPALMRSAQISLDGKPLEGWNEEFFSTVFGSAIRRIHSMSVQDASMDSSTAIRPGDAFTLLSVRVPNAKMLQTAAKHRLALDFCYGSINGKYWTLHYEPQVLRSDEPVPVARCTSNHVISAPFSPFVPPARH